LEENFAMVEILEQPGQFIIRIGGQEYTRYLYSGNDRWKPNLCPLRAANGLSLLADSPTDHRHHHGIWIGHGRVNDSDFWLERYNSGRIIQQSFEKVTNPKHNSASVVTHNDWIDAAGVVQLRDDRTISFYDCPVESRYFDLEVTISTPGDEPVQLHPTNEAGIPHIRVAEGLSVRSGGTLTNAEGKTNERGTYRQPSAWLDCSGKLGRLECGIALFDHPKNPVHPTPWFTRDYGPFSPNYGFFEYDPTIIEPGNPLKLRYRVYTHSGNVTEGGVAEAWEEYAARPSK
jgi:hypothetical protein